MWSKLDDALIDHSKVFAAGDLIGRNGPAIAIGLFAIGLMWTNKHLTDGFLPLPIVKRFQHVDKPLKVARALVTVNLWHEVDGGFRIHDFHAYNDTADEVKSGREWDRRRKSLYSDPDLVKAIKTRDEGRCRYCGQQVDWKDRRSVIGGQFDHVVPRGPNTLTNIVTACRGCNMKKGDRTPEAAGMVLLAPGSKG